MPWKVTSGRKECSGYAVIDDKGKVVGCHPTKAEATAQQRALYAAEANKSHEDSPEDTMESLWDGTFSPKINRK